MWVFTGSGERLAAVKYVFGLMFGGIFLSEVI
jgi:hypothetical protein